MNQTNIYCEHGAFKDECWYCVPNEEEIVVEMYDDPYEGYGPKFWAKLDREFDLKKLLR